MPRWRDPGIALLAGLLALGGAVLAEDTATAAMEDQYAFMPPGGRAVLTGLLLPDDAAGVAEAAALQQDRDAWADWARGLETDADDRAIATFAAYAALNFPISGDTAELPPDGKDLSIAQCQFCHSFFTGYLMQKRDETSWLGTFKPPFHKEIPMTETERATFAAYSAINMPLKFDEVPPELRF